MPISKRLVVPMCVLALACLIPDTPYPPRRVGVLPVRGVDETTIYVPGFGEGFVAWSLVTADIEPSGTPGDIFLLAAMVVSLLTGTVAGVVEAFDDPPDEDLVEAAEAVRKHSQAVRFADVLREAIASDLSVRAEYWNPGAFFPFDEVVLLERTSDIKAHDLSGLLLVEIEEIVVSTPWDNPHPAGAIGVTARADLNVIYAGEKLSRSSITNARGGDPIEWAALAEGDPGRFARSFDEAVEVAASSLAAEIVNAFWTREDR